jgi:hypothetical protein
MNKELAESYVQYGIKATVFTEKSCTAFLPFNILFLMIAIALYRELYFIVIVTLVIITAIATSMLFRKKWSAFTGLLSQATQFVIFVIAIDCIYFGMYNMADIFVWYEYLISIIIQIIAFLVSIQLVVNSAKRHDISKKPVINTTVGAVAGLVCASTSIICKIFFTEVSASVILTIMSLLMNIMILLSSYVIVMAYYRAFLIKKYDLEIQI